MYEPCVCFKFKNNSHTIIALYVVDFFILLNSDVETDYLKRKLS